MRSEKSPFISVIIPTYNRSRYIVEAVESVFMQTYTEYEIVVVDDGSTDGTADVLEHLISTGLITYIHQHNKGVSEARNTGIASSKGKFVAFLDSDDLWGTTPLEELSEALLRHPDCKVAFSATTFFGDAQDVGRNNAAFQRSVSRCLQEAFDCHEGGVWVSNGKLLHTLLQYGFPFRCQAALVDRDFLSMHDLSFDRKISYTEEAHLMTFASFYTSFVYSEQINCYIRRHCENDGDVQYGSKIADSYEVRIDGFKRFFKDKILSREQERALDTAIFYLQSDVMRIRSREGNLFRRMKEGGLLLFRAPSYRSLKSSIKCMVGGY